MASYTRQSSFSDGDTISSSLFNNEYNQLVTAFSYSSSGTTGHRHDGTAAEGGNIHTIGDQDFLNKIVVDSSNNRWGVYVQVSGAAVEQIRFQDGSIVPVTSNDIDLGTSSLQFKDLHIDGTANIDSLTLTSGSTVTVILDEDDLSTNSATALATQQSIKAYVDSQVTGQALSFSGDSGGSLSIDLDSEALTITGGTGIDTTGSTNDMSIAIDSTVATLTGSQTLTNKTLTSPDINGGTIDGATIGGSSAGDITYANLSDGTITITAFADEDDMSSNSATLVPTQQSVKAYVDAQITAEDLDFQADSGGALSIDLDSETMTFTGGTGIDTSGSGNAVTFAIDSTVTTLAGTQTLTNKTLTTPVITSISNSGTVTLPSGTTTLVGTATSDVLTNKTISGSSNTLSNIGNSSLSNSSVSFGGISVALGSSDATPAFDLSDATGYTGDSSLVTTGTISSGVWQGTAVADTYVANDLTISGGTVNNTVIGGSSPAAADFTTVDTTGNATIGGNLAVTGNLTINGTTSTVNSTTVTIDDPIFTLGGDTTPSTDDNKDRGIEFKWHNGTGAKLGFFGYDDSASVFTFIPDASNTSEVFSGSAGNVAFGAISGTSFASTGNMTFGDNDKAIFGAGSDLQIYHDGNHSYIEDSGTGAIKIKVGDFRVENASGNNLIKGVGDVATLHHAGSEKLATTATGIDVTGTVTADDLTLSDSTNPTLTITDTTTPTSLVLTAGNLSATIGTTTDHRLKFDTNNIERLRIENNGDISFFDSAGTSQDLFWDASAESLGIGTSTVNRKLEIAGNNNGGAKANYIRITDTDTSATANNQQGGIEFYTSDTTAGIAASIEVLYAGSGGGGEFTFNTAASSDAGVVEAIRIDESGNLLVAKSTLEYENTVGHIFRADGLQSSIRSAGNAADFNRLGSSGTEEGEVIRVSSNGTTIGSIGVTGTNDIEIHSTASNHSGIRLGEGYYIPTDNTAAASDGTVDIGLSTVRYKALYLSNNISLSNATTSAFIQVSDNVLQFGTSSNDPIDFYANNTLHMSLKSDGEFIVNESGNAEGDFRVESDSNSHMLFVDAGVNGIGIGTSSVFDHQQGSALDMSYDGTVWAGNNYWAGGLRTGVTFYTTTAGDKYKHSSRQANQIYHNSQGGSIHFYSAAAGTAGDVISWREMAEFDRDEVVFNNAGVDQDFRVESDNDNHCLFVDALNDRVLIGNSSTAGGQDFAAIDAKPGVSGQLIQLGRDDTSLKNQILFSNPNGAVGSIQTSGSATAYNTSSDARLKENIADADDSGELIDAIQVRQFDWIADGEHQRYGMVAQELNTVAPEAVSEGETEDDMMAVDYSKLVPMLVKEIQSLRARVAQLENT